MNTTETQPTVEIDDVLPTFRFAERHRRVVAAPIEQAWRATLAVTMKDVRIAGPLVALRGLPSRQRRRDAEGVADQPMLELFAGRNYVPIRIDEAPPAGRALVLYGAAARFWSPAHIEAIAFEGLDDFLSCDRPGLAKMAISFEAVDRGGTTELITETRVVGTDAAANRAFTPYWALIRIPSGLIRRSWLAAIARRAGRDDG